MAKQSSVKPYSQREITEAITTAETEYPPTDIWPADFEEKLAQYYLEEISEEEISQWAKENVVGTTYSEPRP